MDGCGVLETLSGWDRAEIAFCKGLTFSIELLDVWKRR